MPPKRKSKFNAKQIQAAYASMSRTDYGEIVLWDLAQQFWERTSVPPDGNANLTNFNEGKRFVVLYIRSQIELGEGNIDGIVDAGRGGPSFGRAGTTDTDDTIERDFDPVERA
jgi:hypothetical protein